MNIRCSLHFQKFSSNQFKRKSVTLSVVDFDSKTEIEHKDIVLSDYIKGSVQEGDQMFNLCLSKGGFSMISLSWRPDDSIPSFPPLSLKSALSMKVVASNFEMSPKLLLDCPRSKTFLDDNITYYSGMCNNQEPATPVVVAENCNSSESTE